jgi:hypothetical protein
LDPQLFAHPLQKNGSARSAILPLRRALHRLSAPSSGADAVKKASRSQTIAQLPNTGVMQ